MTTKRHAATAHPAKLLNTRRYRTSAREDHQIGQHLMAAGSIDGSFVEKRAVTLTTRHIDVVTFPEWTGNRGSPHSASKKTKRCALKSHRNQLSS